MTAPPMSSTAPAHQAAREEAKRRRQAVQQALHDVLSDEDLESATSLCDDAFPPDQPFSASMYCQRLVEALPHADLTPIARLRLLREIRQRVAEHGVDARTKIILLPPELLQPEAPQEKIVETAPVTSEPEPLASKVAPATPVVAPETVPLPKPQHEPAVSIRKPIQLIGNYWANLDDTPTGNIVVTKLSRQDITFTAQFPHQIKTGNHLSILFELDDSNARSIWQSVQVRLVAGDRVEATWRNPDNLDDALTLYLS